MHFQRLVFGLLSVIFLEREVQALSIARSPPSAISILQNLRYSQDPGTIDANSTFQVYFDIDDGRQKVRLDLQPSRNVISTRTEVRHLRTDEEHGDSDKVVSLRSPLLYKGESLVPGDQAESWRKVGWTRVMLRRRDGRHILEGAFTLNGEQYHISLSSNLRGVQLSQEGHVTNTNFPFMVVWKDLDQNQHNDLISQRSFSNESLCEAQTPSLSFDRRGSPSFKSNQELRKSLDRRQDSLDPDGGTNGYDPTDNIGSTRGCPTTRRVALLGLVTDCSYTAEFDSVDDARQNIISQVNIASQVYEDTFNISLSIRNLTISDSSCPSTASTATAWNRACTADISISNRLNLFSAWRNRFRDDNAAWTLLSACNSGSTVGIAWIASLCGSRGRSFRGGTSTAATNVVIRTAAEWQVFAHELAHNFGAAHDCTSSTCGSSGSQADNCCPLSASTCDARGRYLMNPSSNRALEDFSPCSIGTICSAIGDRRIDTSCLVSEDEVPDVNDSTCGNGIVEPGEDCDCGGERGCSADSCCNPDTCQLRNGAVCDPDSDACCTDECQVASSGQVCRESAGSCDPEETCDGLSSQCPEDVQDCDNRGNGGGSGGSGGRSDSSWFDRNRTAVIATAASVGGVFVALIIFCILSACIRKAKRNKRNRLQQNDPFTVGAAVRNPQPMTGQRSGLQRPPMVYRYA